MTKCNRCDFTVAGSDCPNCGEKISSSQEVYYRLDSADYLGHWVETFRNRNIETCRAVKNGWQAFYPYANRRIVRVTEEVVG